MIMIDTDTRDIARYIKPPVSHIRKLPIASRGAFKSYMSFRALTCRTSKQYALQKRAHTNAQGFRMVGKRYMVAMGTYYTKKVGKMFKITLDTGKTFEVIVGDIKQNKHTDAKHMYAKRNKDIIEFIVDPDKISRISRAMGNMVEFRGNIVKIEEVVK